jgi:GT2 family glycosyltransferase
MENRARAAEKSGQSLAAASNDKGSGTPKTVSMIVLNWNGKRLLKECLSSLSGTEYHPFRIVAVDNGSTDGSAEMVRGEFPWVELLETGRNLGYPGGNNVGLRYVMEKHAPDYVLLLNNDTKVIDPQWLTWLVKRFESDKAIGIVGCLLVAPGGNIQKVGLEVMPGVHLPFLSQDMHRPALGCSLIRREVVEKVGLFDEGYFPMLFEDVDYIKRASRASFKAVLERKSMLLHYGSATIGKRPRSSMVYGYRKNATRYLRKYYWYFLVLSIPVSYAGCFAMALETSRVSRAASISSAFRSTTRGIARGLVDK